MYIYFQLVWFFIFTTGSLSASGLFSPTHFGVTFDPCMFPSNWIHKQEDGMDSGYQIIKTQLKTVISRFSTVYVEFKSAKLSRQVPKAIAELNAGLSKSLHDNSKTRAHVLLAYECDVSKVDTQQDKSIFETVRKFANEVNVISSNTVTTLVLVDQNHVFAKNTSSIVNHLKSLRSTMTRGFQYKLAAQMDILQYCISHTIWGNLVQLFSVLDTFVFTVKALPYIASGLLTAQRYIYYFDKCREKIVSSGFNKEITFLTGYPKDGNGAEEDVVMFWQELNAWAIFYNVTVILKEALDRNHCTNPSKETGWWTVQQTINGEIVLEEKIKKLGSIRTNKMTSKWGIEDPIYRMLTCAVVLIVTLVSLVIHWILYKRYRNMEASVTLANAEIKEFFNGKMNSERCTNAFTRVPYDSAKYEVELGNFFYNGNNILGSGKFGAVYRGKIQKNRETVTVAVKTIKYGRSNCAAQRGLLSEIKVLSYLGTHKYIIKLMGAYTRDLEKGKNT